MKALIAQFMQESNTFMPIMTELDKFKKCRVHFGKDAEAAIWKEHNEIKGFYEVLNSEGISVSASTHVHLGTGGVVSEKCFNEIADRIIADIKALHPEIILLALHGGMVVENYPDGTGELISRCRNAAGDKTVIGVTTDLHANQTPQIIASADFICGYKTYPHIDLYERGEQAARLSIKIARGEIKTYTVLKKLPMLFPPVCSDTRAPLLKPLMDRANEIENLPGVHCVTVSLVQPWLDVPYVGSSVVVSADNTELAEKFATELADRLWHIRDKYELELLNMKDALEKARKTKGRPVIISDPADNPSSGGPGDTAEAIAEVLKHAPDLTVYANICDEEVAKAAAAAGVGKTIKVKLGYKIQPLFGEPIDFEGEVAGIYPGIFEFIGPMYHGSKHDRGTTVVLRNGKLFLEVTERAVENCDPELYNSCGLKIEDADVVIVRSPNGFKANFEGLHAGIVYADTFGASCQRFERLPFNHIKWRMYPMYKDAEITQAIIATGPTKNARN